MYRLLYNEFHIIIYIADYSSLAGIIHCMDGMCRIADTNIWMAPCVSIHQDIYEGFRRLYLKYCMKLLNIYCLTSHVFSLCFGNGGVRIFLAECVIWREYCGGRGVLHTCAFLSSTSLIHFDMLSYYPTNRLPFTSWREDFDRRECKHTCRFLVKSIPLVH